MAIRPSHATILFQSDFETGEYQSYGFSPQGNQKAVVVSLPQPVCRGNYSVIFSLDFNDPVTYRTDLLLSRNSPFPEFTIGKEYWVGFAIFLPKSWKPDHASEVLFSFHGRPDKDKSGNYIEDWRNPPFAIRTQNTSWLATYLMDSKKITVNKNYEESGTIDMGTFKTGGWTSFVIHTKWTYGPDGFIKIWKDGQLVGQKTGGIGFNDDLGPYLKIGIYKKIWDLSKSWGRATDVSSRTQYIDAVRVGDSRSSYNEVLPSCGAINGTIPAIPVAPRGLSIQVQ